MNQSKNNYLRVNFYHANKHVLYELLLLEHGNSRDENNITGKYQHA